MEAYHLVFTTHNSRTSRRMIKYRVIKGLAIELGLEEEIALTEIFRDLILENGYLCLAYTIHIDQVRLILVCDSGKLVGIVQKLKSISSKLFHRLNISMGHDPLKHKNHLWSQKFYHSKLEAWQNDNKTKLKGYTSKDSFTPDTIHWIKNFRKYKLKKETKKLLTVIAAFTIDINHVSDQLDL